MWHGMAQHGAAWRGAARRGVYGMAWLRVAPQPPHFLHNLFGVDFDVSSRLEVSRLEIIDADTQDRFVY